MMPPCSRMRAFRMIFVRNEHGSHNPREAMELQDLLAGIAVMREAIREAVQ